MMSFDEWSSCILANCGHYYGKPLKNNRKSIGDFQLRQSHGVAVADISCKLDRIERLEAGIRQDDNEYLFLLIPKAGEVNVLHQGLYESLLPGDCLLLDSTRPADLVFAGGQSNFLSVHLPRSLCFAGRSRDLAIGRRFTRSHVLHASLCALFDGANSAQGPSSYVFEFVAMMFRLDGGRRDGGFFNDRHDRYRHVGDTIDSYLTETDFSVDRLAGLVNMSRRQLQRDFRDNGTTFTRALSERRMKLVVSHLRMAAESRSRPNISDLAYRAGFSDLSHFNRSFRELYRQSPTQYFRDLQASVT